MKPTLLIVEDDKAVRDSLQMVLEVYGYTVEVFASGEDFISQAQFDDGSVLILDVHLPGTSGLGVLEHVRARGISAPAILVSALSTEPMRARAAGLNALAFFDKPVDIDRLLNAIDGLRS